MPMEWQIALANEGLAVPLKIFTIVAYGLKQKNHPPQVEKKRPRL